MNENSLVKKLVEVLHELGPMAKSKRNPHFGYNYLGEGQLMAALRDKLASRGIFLFTSVESITPHYADGEAKSGVHVAVTTLHTFIEADTGQTFAVKGAGMGWDSTDKGVYKAITGATKYALMKCFLVTDEQDPEASAEPPTAKPPAAAKHSRTRPYEDEPAGKSDVKSATDLIQLKAYLTEHGIPDGFFLRLLAEKKLIDGHTKTVADIKPGTLARALLPGSLAALLLAWKAHEADEAEGAENAPETRIDRSVDQTTQRQPAQQTLQPEAIMRQEGHKNWRTVKIHWGDDEGKALGSLSVKSLSWWLRKWKPKPYKGKWGAEDLLLDAALCLASAEMEVAQ
jgi:hypothetical protein